MMPPTSAQVLPRQPGEVVMPKGEQKAAKNNKPKLSTAEKQKKKKAKSDAKQ